jgi:DNA-binding NarL/FixJ family response regulator
MVKEVLAVGARGYIVKSDVGPELLNALEALSRHKPYFTRKVTEIMLREFTTDGQRVPLANVPITAADRLTPREREIVQLLAEGRSSKEVATALGISVKTAETHRTNLMRKLDLHSIGEIVRYAVRNHIIEP